MEKSKLTDYLTTEIGDVDSVDTKKIIINVQQESILNILKINDIVIFSGNTADEKLIGMITRVSKKKIDDAENDEEIDGINIISKNACLVTLVGSFYLKIGAEKTNVFKRAINTYPEINSKAYLANEGCLQIIMNSLSGEAKGSKKLKIGSFTSNKDVPAILDGNKFFQRHACIVGSTGSGKSYTVVNMLEKIKELEYSNVVLFDLHGEYNELPYAKQIKISDQEGALHIPLWFFNYEEIHSLFIESSEGTSSNQRAAVIDYILKSKKEYINSNMVGLSADIITADTPIPFSANKLREHLEELNVKEEETGEFFKSGPHEGEAKTKKGQFNDKLTNLITRLQTKVDDKKYAFVFNEKDTGIHDYLNHFTKMLMDNNDFKIKVIDLSEIPSDMLPIIIGIITRLIYDVQFWMTPDNKQVRHPLVLMCDEAHIYMNNDTSKLKATEKKSLEIFEKISKEGRKYGVALLIVSQRPSELNSTIISQCNNIISLKITNDRDKSAVASMLTDSLVGLVDMLSNLDVGECIVVGDAIMLPSKIRLDEPKIPPKSSTVDFWDRWNDGKNTTFDIDGAIISLIKQSRI